MTLLPYDEDEHDQISYLIPNNIEDAKIHETFF